MIFVQQLCLLLFVKGFCVVAKRQFKHHHNELYSQITNIETFRNMFQVLSKELFVRSLFEGGSNKRKSTNYDKHGHGQEKMRPSVLCLGKKIRGEIKCFQSWYCFSEK